MAKFITHIQLQDADEKDYDILLKEFEKESFKIEEHAAKSNAYITGKGAFSREGNITLLEVTDTVIKVASLTGKKYSFYILKDKYVSMAN